MADAALNGPTSLAAFLAWEERQAERYELAGGVVRRRSGGTGDHDQIAVNIAAALRVRLRARGCFVHASNLKVAARAAEDVLYPDVFVRCGAPVGQTCKKLAYKRIPTLRVIAYVSQDEPRIDLVRRGEGGTWDDDRPVEGLAARLDLPEIGVVLPMAEVYEDTAVAPAPQAASS